MTIIITIYLWWNRFFIFPSPSIHICLLFLIEIFFSMPMAFDFPHWMTNVRSMNSISGFILFFSKLGSYQLYILNTGTMIMMMMFTCRSMITDATYIHRWYMFVLYLIHGSSNIWQICDYYYYFRWNIDNTSWTNPSFFSVQVFCCCLSFIFLVMFSLFYSLSFHECCCCWWINWQFFHFFHNLSRFTWYINRFSSFVRSSISINSFILHVVVILKGHEWPSPGFSWKMDEYSKLVFSIKIFSLFWIGIIQLQQFVWVLFVQFLFFEFRKITHYFEGYLFFGRYLPDKKKFPTRFRFKWWNRK